MNILQVKRASILPGLLLLLALDQPVLGQTLRANLLQDAGSDWSIGGSGENIEFREPEHGNQLFARIRDGWGFETFAGAPNMSVYGSILVRDGQAIRVGSDGNSKASVTLHAADRYRSSYVKYAEGPLIFQREYSNFIAPLTLQQNGTVLINAQSSYDGRTVDTRGHELSVVGGILCEEVEVIGDVPASDYVFEDDYDLMPLDSVAAFIEREHHLPGVPSAEEFEGGYKVGEMDDLLLRKVEELTLYVIELQQTIDSLKTAH